MLPTAERITNPTFVGIRRLGSADRPPRYCSGMDAPPVARAERAIRRAARSAVDISSFAERTATVLRDVVPHDAACVITLDPTTLMVTGTYKFGLLAGHHEQDDLWAEIEYGCDDPTALARLAMLDEPVGAVSLSGGVDASPRSRRLLAPAGFGDELRMVARDAGGCWGSINLFRSADGAPFHADDLEAMASLSPAVAFGLRTLLLADPHVTETAPSAGPAVIIVDADGQVLTQSAAAEQLLGSLQTDPRRSPPTSTILGLTMNALRAAEQGGHDVSPARMRLPSGTWVLAHASPLNPVGSDAEPDGEVDRGRGAVAITFEEVRPFGVLPLMVSAYGLTRREQDVLRLVLQGHSTKAMARALYVSAHTVTDHLKSIFQKTGVRSRGELVASVFAHHTGDQRAHTVDLEPTHR